MTTDPSEIQVLYEISLSIRPAADVARTVETAVSTYLQKLNCSAAAAFETRDHPDGTLTHTLVATLPARSAIDDLDAVVDLFPETAAARDAALPLVDEADGTYRHVMELPEFGLLVLFTEGSPIDESVRQGLTDLNEKLATACNRVAVPKRYEAQYRELFEDAPVMFALTRQVADEHVIADCNRRFATKLGYTVDDLRDRPLADVLVGEFEGTVLAEDVDADGERAPGTEERTLRASDDTEIVATMRATPRLDADGNVVGAQVLFVDVTELKRHKQQISVLNRILRHNIRNDVSLIQGKVDVIVDRGTDAETVAHLNDIHTKAESLLSKAELAREIQRLFDDTDVARHDLVATVESLVERARWEFPGATVDLSVDADDVPVLATAALDRALWELIENACEHAGAEPSVTVEIERGAGTATVTVADDGPGIPEIERRILGEGEETALEHGSGLGLWLVYWVFEASGADLTFDCTDGTTVSVELSLADADAEAEADADADADA